MSEQDGSYQESAPAVGGPEGTPAAAEPTPPYGDPNDPYEKRYTDLRSWTDRVSQENAEQRQQMAELRQRQELYDLMLSTDDADTRSEIAEALGYTLAESEPEPTGENEDPLAQYDERLGRLEQSLSARDQEQADAQYAAQVRQIMDQQLGSFGLSEEDGNWVLAYALHALPITEDGLPDIQQAYEVYQQQETARQRAWAQTKRAPHIAPNGQTATEVPNLDNRQERQDWITRRIQDGEQAGY